MGGKTTGLFLIKRIMIAQRNLRPQYTAMISSACIGSYRIRKIFPKRSILSLVALYTCNPHLIGLSTHENDSLHLGSAIVLKKKAEKGSFSSCFTIVSSSSPGTFPIQGSLSAGEGKELTI